jgi:hypothetical protein
LIKAKVRGLISAFSRESSRNVGLPDAKQADPERIALNHRSVTVSIVLNGKHCEWRLV